MDRAEQDALLTLLLTPGLGPTLTARCVEAMGSAAAAVEATPQQLAGVRGISPGTAATLRSEFDAVRARGELDRERELMESHGVGLVTSADAEYPTLLGHIPDPPPLLWVRGSLREDDALAVGLVGSRKCSHYGREQADRFAQGVARAGLCVISGGAYGIDAAAHQGALRAGGRTIAVIGSGLANPYPKDHAKLFDQIVNEERGAVVSELPMSIAPRPENFPRRNRIISGMSLGILVIEAALRSGALITARLCVEEHNRELMAVPGRVDSTTSAGCHKILREGWATLVTSPSDVIECLGEAGRLLEVAQDKPALAGGGNGAGKAVAPAKPAGAAGATPSLFTLNLSDSQQKVWDALDSSRGLDELVAWTGLPVHTLQADLTMLEIRGSVQRKGGLFHRAKTH